MYEQIIALGAEITSAAGLGVEPKLEASKAPVLPLDDPAIVAYTLYPARNLTIDV